MQGYSEFFTLFQNFYIFYLFHNTLQSPGWETLVTCLTLISMHAFWSSGMYIWTVTLDDFYSYTSVWFHSVWMCLYCMNCWVFIQSSWTYNTCYIILTLNDKFFITTVPLFAVNFNFNRFFFFLFVTRITVIFWFVNLFFPSVKKHCPYFTVLQL